MWRVQRIRQLTTPLCDGIGFIQYVPTMAWRSSTGSASHFRLGCILFRFELKLSIKTRPAASMTASSEVWVGAHEICTIGPPERFGETTQRVGSLRPHVASLG